LTFGELKSTGTMDFAIKPQGISCCILSLRRSFSAIDNTRQFQGFSVALDLKKCKEANLLKTFCQPGFE